MSDIVRLRRDQMIDSDGQVVRTLRIKMAKTERWIDRALREDAREAVRDYLATRNDTYPWLFSKYPPAEPGALSCEPLEAANSGSLTRPR